LSSEQLFSEAFLRRLERLALLFRQTASSQMQGERRSSRRGQSVEFSDFRPYSLGDDFRRIDWNAYARLERLFIKLFVAEEDTTLHLLVDTTRSMDWGEPNKLRYGIQAAGALGYIALVGLDRVTVLATPNHNGYANSYFPPVRGKQSAIKLFSFLQSISPCLDPIETNTWLSSYTSKAANPGVVVLISDLMSDGWETGLNLLRGRGHDVSVVHLIAPDEAEPAISGDFRLIDSESQAGIEITADFETLEKYKTHLKDWQEAWRLFCRARNISYIPVQTSLPLEELLFSWLPKQGVLR
jgi:uncharacterized protein (DUF58 family)